MTNQDLVVSLVVIVVVIAIIYLPLIYFLVKYMRDWIALSAFARALYRIGEELSNKDDWASEAIARLESIYDQSELKKRFASAGEVVEHLHYLVYSQASVLLNSAWFYWRNELKRTVLLAIRAELVAQRQPHSSLRGELRRLVEAVNANLDPVSNGGKVALEHLANYMQGIDKTVARQQLWNNVLTVITVVATLTSIVSVLLQVWGGISLDPTV